MSSSRVAVATVPPALATLYALRRNALAPSGILASWLVGVVTGWASPAHAVHLYWFFLSGSRLTALGAARKEALEGGAHRGGEGSRTAAQVLCNGGVQTLISLAHIILGRTGGRRQQRLSSAHLCAFAAAAGDTWASEVGVLSRWAPRLVVAPWRTVPRGTNGGVSPLGLLASLIGGASVGLAQAVFDYVGGGGGGHSPGASADNNGLPLTPILQGATAGFLGSMLDSLLGATLQYSGKAKGIVVNTPVRGAMPITASLAVLSNDQVNLLSIVAMAWFGYRSHDYFFPPSASVGRLVLCDPPHPVNAISNVL